MTKRRRALVTVVVEEDGPFEGTLICPRCKGKHVHPISVTVNPAGEATGAVAVKADGIHLDQTKLRMGNTTRIRLVFGCASGHNFELSFDYIPNVLETWGGILHPDEPKPGEYEILGRRS